MWRDIVLHMDVNSLHVYLNSLKDGVYNTTHIQAKKKKKILKLDS